MRRSSLLPILFAVSASAPFGVLPQPDSKMTGSARQYIDGQCRAAAMSITDPKLASTRLVGPADHGSMIPIEIPPRQVIEWHYGPTPGRYVAILAATRANVPVQIRVSVDLRRLPCKLAAWQTVPAVG